MGVGFGVSVGFGVGDGVGDGVGLGVGVFVGLGVGVGVHPEGKHLRGITEEAALTGLILMTTKNRPDISIHKTTNIIIIAVFLPTLFDITNSFILIKICVNRIHPKICVFLTTNTSAAPALTIRTSSR